ncbi:MAG: protein-disulfide reductase DsbD family protein [Alphaproteobacteria bacterium]|uniref:protein-disulfide reductase DsbD family protein n=1 Tax=Marinobacter salarius TaxID=1420917 RepID=UPI0032EB6718
MKQRISRLGLLLLLGLATLVFSLTGALAQMGSPASDWAGSLEDLPARSRLIAATTGVGQLDEIRVGLEIELQPPGFKTYWRTPGGPGFPTSIVWDGSTNVADAEFKWPAPTRFDVLGFDSIGYKKHVIFPIIIKPEEVGQPINLRANLAYLACDDICVPMSADLELDLPAGPADPSEFANQIDQFRAKVPVTDGTLVGLNFEGAGISGTTDSLVLEIAFSAGDPFLSPDIFVEGPEEIKFGRPEIALDGTIAVFRVPALDAFGENPVKLAGQPLLVTLVENGRALEVRITPTQDAFDVAALSPTIASGGGASVASAGDDAAGTADATNLPLWTILGFALLGGMILNIFPCVLPVLSIKLLSVVGHGGDDSHQVRIGFMASVGGIIAAFLVLATGVVGLQAAGQTVGWGIQFQQPLFLVGMVLILTLFACNMWGLFEIRLPGMVADTAVRHSGGTSLKGHFFSGGFTTLLATPCTAPFLTTAVGFALTRGVGEVYAVFTALGVGLAMPFIFVATFPKVVTKLPKPGPWMVTVKKVLSLALIATAVWLLSILATQVSVLAASIVALLMLVVALVIGGRIFLPKRAGRAIPVAMAAALALVVPALLPRTEAAPSQVELRAAVAYRPFDQAAIPGLVSGGNVVFVHVTADWCITCKVNEKRVLEAGEVAAALARDDIVVMEADWTLPSDEVAAYLASFGRFGIPFDAVYGPDTPGGTILPELLTGNAVMTALSGASPALRLVQN